MLSSQQLQGQTFGSNITWNKQDTVTFKFERHDKNRDGLLDQAEFRALLKEIFSSHKSALLDDAIEETVWRTPYANITAAKQAVANINETFPSTKSNSSSPTSSSSSSHSLPKQQTFNSQGQLFEMPLPTNLPQPINPFILPQSAPVELPPYVDPVTLPPPVLPTPEPAQPTTARPILPQIGQQAIPMNKPPSMQPAKMPPKSILKNPIRPPPQDSMDKPSGPAPIRVLPHGPALSHPGLNSAAAASEEEGRAFVEYINTNVALQSDEDLKGILPIKQNSDQIYTIVSEGWLFCKLLNAIQPNIIPAAQIKLRPRNAFEKIENHTLAIQAAKKLGCSVVNIGPEDLLQGKPRLVLGLLWQIIKRDVLSKVSLAHHPEIYKLAKNPANLKEISESSPEEVLLKWANHHLKKANGVEISNFSNDVKDGTTYALLMNQIAPDVCSTAALSEPDAHRRAQMVVENAKKLNCDRFITPADILNANSKLNLAFVADLFNKHSGLELPTLEEMERLKKQNSSLSGILDEAEARLRQILADGRLAHELQQQEILLYRQRKLKEQEQLEEQEAMLRAQLQREEMQLMKESRMKELTLMDQERFAREEQRKEEMKAGRTTSSASLAKPSTSSSSTSKSAPIASRNVYSDSAPAYNSTSSVTSSKPASSNVSSYNPNSQAMQGTAEFVAASLTAPQPSTSHSTYSSTTYPSSSAYSTSSTPAPVANYTTTTVQTAPAQTAYTSYPGYSQSTYSTGFSQPAPTYEPIYSQPTASYAPTTTYSAPAYTAATYAPTAYPSEYAAYPANTYPADATTTSSHTTTQHTYMEAPPVSSMDTDLLSPISRRRGMFERFGKKIDKAFH